MITSPDRPGPSENEASTRHREGWNRREFLKWLSIGAGAAATQPWRAMAGPFTRSDFDKLVPADKKLRPEWVKSLTERGERTVYRGEDLAKIGMPVGGLCAGQVYLGGDGKLWHWDIFNQRIATGAEHYAKPPQPFSPFDQGFALRVAASGKSQSRKMDAAHWKEVTFIGEYPVGYVTYADPDCPVAVRLEAFSPFIPLDPGDSSLPAIVMEFTFENKSADAVEMEFEGWLENAVCLHSSRLRSGIHHNNIVREPGLLFLNCSVEDLPSEGPSDRSDIVFEDFEGESYGSWTATGTAFGAGPVEAAKMPAYQGDVGATGKRLVNSHASAPGNDVAEKDAATGQLTSPSFTISRHYITFLIGGGNHQGRTCMNLLIDGQVERSATGANSNKLRPMTWDVRRWTGKTALIVIVDNESGPWGNISIDNIVFTDRATEPFARLTDESDFGTMGLGLLDPRAEDAGSASLSDSSATSEIFSEAATQTAAKPFGEKLAGSLRRKLKLAPGGSGKAAFVLTWHFPNLKLDKLPPRRFYATKFDSARAVAGFLAANFDRLSSQTRLWHQTWYDSTLPFWFLDRTFLNTSILATSTCYRFDNDRFYSWEGVGCCEGTCGHVWQYAQAVARVFPQFERYLREKIDLGSAMQPDGSIHFRGEFNDFPAIDAQAGVILRSLREHQMSADSAFLKRNWPQIKKAMGWLIMKDANGDGLIEGNQHNTLDTDWFGPVAWLSGIYLAALLAAETMAREVGDQEFAGHCEKILAAGQKNFVEQLFDGEYFIDKVDPRHLDAINSGTGCEIDQVMGQSWAFQAGLGRVLPEQQTRSALQSLWRYNFTPDVGPYREAYKPGRWYAMPGEAGLLMCTFPRTGWDYEQAKGKGPTWAAGYFNECMNGFEYEAAGHMIWEGMLTEGLAVTRAVHDRYHASRRNPWNEVECGDHYVRSMASYGIFLAACGFEYHGPKGHIGFAPRLAPENFKAPFTAAEGWGSYSQRYLAAAQSHQIEIKRGALQLNTLAVMLAPNARLKSVTATRDSQPILAQATQNGTRVQVSFGEKILLATNAILKVTLQLES